MGDTNATHRVKPGGCHAGKSESEARERVDNQGIEECLNRAPRGTEGLREEAGRRHRVLRVPKNGETVNTKSEQA